MVDDVSVVHFDGDQGESTVFVELVLIIETHEVGQFFDEPVFVISDWLPLFVLVLFVVVADVVEHSGAVIGPDDLAGCDGQLSEVVLHPGMTPLDTLALLHGLESVSQKDAQTLPHLSLDHPHPVLDAPLA